ncbi:MAG: sensor histidine kinase [Polyangiales bacterium]
MSGAALLRPLAARLNPAVAVLAALLATGAPLAHHVMGVLALRGSGAALATSVAEEVAEEVRRRPTLWRYDTIKLVAHLRAYRAQPGVARIEVLDGGGRPVGEAVARPRAVLWSEATVRVRGEALGKVWVAMDLRALRLRSLALLALFSAAATALGLAVSRSALGTAAEAEGRIAALLGELRGAAEGLEAQVAARTDELARANDALRTEQRRQREVVARAVAMQEAERRAVARDLHDSVGQALTAIRLNASLAEDDPDAWSRVCATTDGALEELRRALYRLGPAALADAGLADAVARTLASLPAGTSLRVEQDLGELGALSPAAEVTAYRIVQEAVTNALRHGAPTRLSVALWREGDALRLRVEDDGAGLGDAPFVEGAGTRGMRERAELLGGELRVEAAAGGGVRVTATIPSAGDDRADRV